MVVLNFRVTYNWTHSAGGEGCIFDFKISENKCISNHDYWANNSNSKRMFFKNNKWIMGVSRFPIPFVIHVFLTEITILSEINPHLTDLRNGKNWIWLYSRDAIKKYFHTSLVWFHIEWKMCPKVRKSAPKWQKLTFLRQVALFLLSNLLRLLSWVSSFCIKSKKSWRTVI